MGSLVGGAILIAIFLSMAIGIGDLAYIYIHDSDVREVAYFVTATEDRETVLSDSNCTAAAFHQGVQPCAHAVEAARIALPARNRSAGWFAAHPDLRRSQGQACRVSPALAEDRDCRVVDELVGQAPRL